MAKKDETYICSPAQGGCGSIFNKEHFSCPRCNEIGTFELDTSSSSSHAGLKTSGAKVPTRTAKKIRELQAEPFDRFTTGIGELDRVLGGGFVSGSVVLLGGQPGSGKALKDTTLIPLADGGFKRLSDILPGDTLIDGDGKRTHVLNTIYPQVDRAFRLTFSNGATHEACADHIWNIVLPEDVDAKWYQDKRVAQHTTLSLFENFATYREKDTYPTLEHHVIDTYPTRDLKIEPYLVGQLLGGGPKRFSQEHGNLRDVIQQYVSYDPELELDFIPDAYLFADVAQRSALLQGVLTVAADDLSQSSTTLTLPFGDIVHDVAMLLETLGLPYEMHTSSGEQVIHIYDRHMGSALPQIVNIEEIQVLEDDTYICLMVDSPTKTYRIGEQFLTTHNSTLSMSIAEKFADKDFTVLYSSGEESERQIMLRAQRMGVDNDNINIVNETSLEALLGHIDTIQPDFVIVDSLQTIASSEVSGSVGSISQSLEAAHALTRVAKSRGITMLLISQVTKS